jgi:hypothetical protein
VRGAQRFAGHARPETTIGYDNPRELHQTGEFLQVA